MRASSAIAMRPVIASLFFLPVLAGGQTAGQGQELTELLGQIEAIERELQRDMRAQGLQQAELREAETEITRLRRDSAEVERQLAGSREAQSRLLADLERNESAHQEAQAALAAAVRHAWRSGQADNIRALLSGESAGEVERRLAWTGLLVNSWSRRAGEAARLESEARALHEQAGAVESELGGLQRRRAEQIRNLENAAARRRAALDALNRRIGAAGAEIGRLRDRAATLGSLVEDLGEVVDENPGPALPSITRARGELAWPVSGRVLQRFGAGGGGQPGSDGILLEADEGAPVRAPHAGRVVFADWVRGLGFLIVLDHGEDVLSLYAYNDILLGKKGEIVGKGQVIAHAGSTGGRREPGLYFEIRRSGKPVDPIRWLSD